MGVQEKNCGTLFSFVVRESEEEIQNAIAFRIV